MKEDMRLRSDDAAAHPAIAASTPCIKIDDGVPVPAPKPSGRYGGTGLTEALRRLEVGQSFVAPNPRGMTLARVQSDAHTSMRTMRPKKFTSRQVTENGERVVRIWRVA